MATNVGRHGLTEILFAYASPLANNGISMPWLKANAVFYNLTTAIAMLAGRYGLAALITLGALALRPIVEFLRQP